MNAYFVIITENDMPIFEAEFFRPDYLTKLEYDHSMHEFIVHAALDMVDSVIWSNNSYYLKVVDRYGDWLVSAYLASTGDRFMLLHDVRNEEAIRQFFLEAHDLYTKYTLNPFYQQRSAIDSGPFEVKIRLAARKHLDK